MLVVLESDSKYKKSRYCRHSSEVSSCRHTDKEDHSYCNEHLTHIIVDGVKKTISRRGEGSLIFLDEKTGVITCCGPDAPSGRKVLSKWSNICLSPPKERAPSSHSQNDNRSMCDLIMNSDCSGQ